MCTIVLLRRPDHPWPLVIGANRDEMLDRPWQPPARHWPDRPDVIAGLDVLAGGSWLGLNNDGVVAAMLNRANSLGPAPGKRSRGELVLEALDHADAADAADALAHLDPDAYRSFNMVIADNRDAVWLRNRGEAGAGIEVMPIPDGVSMLTALDMNDAVASPRVRLHRPRFAAAAAPDPDAGTWGDWPELLAAGPDSEGAAEAMCFRLDGGFGTVCSSLLAVSAAEPDSRVVWRFAAGPPDTTAFAPVSLA